MKRISIILIAAAAALVSCQSLKEEWQPVFTFGANEPEAFVPTGLADIANNGWDGNWTTIGELKALYKNAPVRLSGNKWIRGQVISDDRSGNLYRELYIQDDTGGIDVKIGKSSLYSDYELGQWIYVRCDDLTLGSYNGMPQLGLEADDTTTNEYETSYIDVQAIINTHIFKGAYDTPLEPTVVSDGDLSAALKEGFKGEVWGKLVTIEDLSYGNEIFALLYPNSNLPHKSSNPENRVFLSKPTYASDIIAGFDYTWGINTWAMSKSKYVEYIEAGNLDEAQVGSGATRYGPITGTPREYLSSGKALDSFGSDADITYKEIMVKYATANYVSHYFTTPGGTTVQVRTSGYSKFCDTPIDEDILSGAKTVSITGILSIYNGSAQFSLIDLDGVKVQK